ncbi:MAG: hypothetical protein KDE57_16995 [Calditrichaeota bacterium]|nr:hypothetical protein [Calditrichota bacterium]
MKKQRKFLSIVILLSLMIVGQSLGLAQSGGCPPWAEFDYIPPEHESMFYGIRSGNLAVKTKAQIRNEALANLANQIQSQVEVEINSSSSQIQNNDDFTNRNRFEETIKSVTDATFFGEDLTEKECLDAAKNRYWIYISLTKEKYEQRMKMRRQLAVQQASGLLDSGNTAVATGQPLQALNHYWNALLAISPFSAYPLYAMNTGNNALLNSELPANFNAQISAIEITNSARKQVFDLNETKESVFHVTVNQNGKKHPLKGVPVIFVLEKGVANIDTMAISDSNGMVKCRIESNKWDAKGIHIHAEIDWRKLFPEDKPGKLFRLNLDAAGVQSEVYLKSPVVFTEFSYSNNNHYEIRDGTVAVNSIKSTVTKLLTSMINAQIANSASDADRIIRFTINAHAIPGVTAGKFRSVEINVATALIDPKSGASLFAPDAAIVRGAGLSYPQALQNAVDKFQKSLKKEIIQPISERIIGN